MRIWYGVLAAGGALGLAVCYLTFARSPIAPVSAANGQSRATPQTKVLATDTDAESEKLAAALLNSNPISSSIVSHCRPVDQPYEPMDERMPCAQESAAVAPTPVAAPKTYTIPADTKVLLQLRSAINTKTAKAGDSIYLATSFPVVVGNRVMIPAGVYVQGSVDRVVRAGRVKGKAQLDMHFTSIIFPNGTVVEIPGMVDALPGAHKQQVKDDGEGTIQQDADKGRNAGKVAEISIPTGGTVGSIGGLASGHPLAGGIAGIGAGLAAAGLVSLFTRGADVNIESGAQVEMRLQRPLILQEENLSGTAANLVPAANQPRPLGKPAPMLCPPGSLGCQ